MAALGHSRKPVDPSGSTDKLCPILLHLRGLNSLDLRRALDLLRKIEELRPKTNKTSPRFAIGSF
jgi:hypothetical protein